METNPAIFAYNNMVSAIKDMPKPSEKQSAKDSLMTRKMPKKQNINNTDVNMRVMSYFQKFRTMKEDVINGRNSKKK
jgi:hypothetical protein